MNLLKHFPRLAAAALFAATASTAVVVADATHAGSPTTQGILASAPAQADAAVVGVGIGVGGPARGFYRWGWRGGSWVRLGFYSGGPGWIPGGYYVGYAPPPYPYAHYFGYYGYHPYYGGWYGHPYWHGWYGRGYYGHPYYGGTHIGIGIRI
jgi:hypothetical protein